MNRTIMICGEPNTGKSTSLRNLKDRDQYAYLNCDDKPLPIGGANAFLVNQRIVDAVDVESYYPQLEEADKCKGVILDSMTYMMSKFHRKIKEEVSGFDIWNEYADFYYRWNDLVKNSNKVHIIMAHTNTSLNEQAGAMESRIQVAGQVGKIGPEADQTLIVTCKQMAIGKLEKHVNKHLVITDQERARGMKYVFSVQLSKETVGDRTRAPWGFWDEDVMYIDNDVQIILDRWTEFYGE